MCILKKRTCNYAESCHKFIHFLFSLPPINHTQKRGLYKWNVMI